MYQSHNSVPISETQKQSSKTNKTDRNPKDLRTQKFLSKTRYNTVVLSHSSYGGTGPFLLQFSPCMEILDRVVGLGSLAHKAF